MFWIGLVTGPLNEPARQDSSLNAENAAALEQEDAHPHGDAHEAPSILGYAFVVAFVAGFGFFILSFVVLGIIPAMQLQAEIERTKPKFTQPLTASEEHGRLIYGREGCAYCHTEQVRTIGADVRRFGAPTAAWETQYDYPQLWGTRRIGPDLSRENGLRTDDWHYAHLYNPRSVVPDSIMPGYSWMYKGSAETPGNDAYDLVAYIRSWGGSVPWQARQAMSRLITVRPWEMSSSYGSQGVSGHSTNHHRRRHRSECTHLLVHAFSWHQQARAWQGSLCAQLFRLSWR